MPNGRVGAIFRFARRQWFMAFLLVVLLLGHMRLVRWYGSALRGSDGQWYYATLRSMVFDRDFHFGNEVALTPHPEQMSPTTSPQTGNVINKYPVGYALAALPLYAGAHAVMSLLHAAGVVAAPTGYELPYQLAASLSHLLLGWLGLAITFSICRRTLGERWSMVAVLMILLGSPLLFYLVDATYMAHAAGVFVFAAVAALSLRLGDNGFVNNWNWIGLGAVIGLGVTLRQTNVVAVIIPIAFVFSYARAHGLAEATRTALPRIGLAVLGAAPFLAVQLIYLAHVFGHPFAYSYGSETFNWLNPSLWGGILSSRHGFLFFAPACLLGVAGLAGAGVRSLGAERTLARSGLAVVLVLVYVNTSWWCWWFGQGFGGRAYVELSPLLILGLAWLLSRSAQPVRWAVLIAGGLATCWTLTLLFLEYTGRIGFSGSESLSDILRRISG